MPALLRLFALDIRNPFMRLFVPLGFLQGVIIYLITLWLGGKDAIHDDWLVSTNTTFLIPGLITAGLVFFLSYQNDAHGQSNKKRAAITALLFGLIHIIFYSFAIVQSPDPSAMVVWYCSASILTYASLPFLQAYCATRTRRPPYLTLFQHAWNNGQIIASSHLLTGLFFLVLLLASSLLSIVNVTIFMTILKQPWFFIPAYFTVKAIGYAVARENEGIVLALRRLCLGFCSFLAPILACFALIFVAILPFAGLEPVWQTRTATPIFLGFAATTILFFNAIFQEGARTDYFSRLNGRLQQIALILLPLFGLLACYSTALRIGQYGLTPDRYYALLLGIIILAYGLIYATAALRPAQATTIIQRGNIGMALALIALALAIHLPFINANNLSAWHRYQLIANNKIAPEHYDLWWLNNELGRAGKERFATLKTLTNHPRQQELTTALTAAEKQENRYDQPIVLSEDTPRNIKDYIVLKPDNAPAVPEALVKLWLKESARELQNCKEIGKSSAKCAIIAADLNHDGQNEYVWVQSWQSKLYTQDKITQQWSEASYEGQIAKQENGRDWHALANNIKTITVKPSLYDALHLDDNVIITFTPKNFPIPKK